MKSAEPSGLGSDTARGCVDGCGMCAPCVFAPEPPGFTQCLWKASDGFKRKFVLGLLLRCGNARVLENVQCALGVTSWSLSAYGRARGPASPRGRGGDGERRGKPPGVDVKRLWDWFHSSPDWIKTRYLCRVFSLCDPELLRMSSNLTSVLLVRQKRQFLQFNSSICSTNRHDRDSDEDSENPALMVVPGSSKSVSGVSQHRDFIGCLPVDLAKRILGLLEDHTLRCCLRVSRHWQQLAKETMEEKKFRKDFQNQIKAMMVRCTGVNMVSPTYANIVQVLVPTNEVETVDIHPGVQKVMPFEAAYGKIKTTTVQMEERNVYCGAYFTKVLLEKEDPQRVVDYRGRSLMAIGSKTSVVQLFYVASETKLVSVMKGHVASIRAVLLCEDRNMVITASGDASIMCWNLKTDRCKMAFYGHTGSVNCLDVHADRLVSGAKDCLVKVWNLNTGKHFEAFNFKHPTSIQCVKISTTNIYSSCNRGLIKIWDMEKASLVRVIDAHRSSVRCLFLDEWHLLSGDLNGQVMAWSISCHAKEHLITFNHPKEVKSLTLVYLRLVTGCVDGKIRIFNFLTGDCLRDITAETEAGRLLSLCFNENSILVNTTSTVKLYQFAKVFWDYTDSAEGSRGDVLAQDDLLAHDDLVSQKSAASRRHFLFTSVGADLVTQVALPSQKSHDGKKPGRDEPLCHARLLSTPTKCQSQVRDRWDNQTLVLSEKATYERIRRRGLHHPPTRDSILLRVAAIQRAQCMDEVSFNMEWNARLRDSWGPHTLQDPLRPDCVQTHICPPWHTHDGQPRRAETCVPVLKRSTNQNNTNTVKQRNVTTAPDTVRQHRPCVCSQKAQPRNPAAHRPMTRVGSKMGLRAPDLTLMRSPRNPEHCAKTSTSLPEIKHF